MTSGYVDDPAMKLATPVPTGTRTAPVLTAPTDEVHRELPDLAPTTRPTSMTPRHAKGARKPLYGKRPIDIGQLRQYVRDEIDLKVILTTIGFYQPDRKNLVGIAPSVAESMGLTPRIVNLRLKKAAAAGVLTLERCGSKFAGHPNMYRYNIGPNAVFYDKVALTQALLAPDLTIDNLHERLTKSEVEWSVYDLAPDIEEDFIRRLPRVQSCSGGKKYNFPWQLDSDDAGRRPGQNFHGYAYKGREGNWMVSYVKDGTSMPLRAYLKAAHPDLYEDYIERMPRKRWKGTVQDVTAKVAEFIASQRRQAANVSQPNSVAVPVDIYRHNDFYMQTIYKHGMPLNCLSSKHEAYKYGKKRGLLRAKNQFLWVEDLQSLLKDLCIEHRPNWKSGLINVLTDSHKLIRGITIRSITSDQKKDAIFRDGEGRIYGLRSIDWSKPVIICEGATDAGSINNAIGVSGLDGLEVARVLLRSTDIKKRNLILHWDNEAERDKQIEQAIAEGFAVLGWKEESRLKDLNELVASREDPLNHLYIIGSTHSYSHDQDLLANLYLMTSYNPRTREYEEIGISAHARKWRMIQAKRRERKEAMEQEARMQWLLEVDGMEITVTATGSGYTHCGGLRWNYADFEANGIGYRMSRIGQTNEVKISMISRGMTVQDLETVNVGDGILATLSASHGYDDREPHRGLATLLVEALGAEILKNPDLLVNSMGTEIAGNAGPLSMVEDISVTPGFSNCVTRIPDPHLIPPARNARGLMPDLQPDCTTSNTDTGLQGQPGAQLPMTGSGRTGSHWSRLRIPG